MTYLARFCSCGVFNPARAKRILEDAIAVTDSQEDETKSKVAKARAAALVVRLGLHAETKVFKNFTLIDGTGRAAAPNSAMIIENGRIPGWGPLRN